MSGISCGIVGLPNVGKSTLFNALTNNHALAANYPFATIEPNTGTVAVPDERLGLLAELVKSQRIVPASVTFVDIAGLVKGASRGEGLGNQFLSHIRSTQAILQVVRAFSDPNVTNVSRATPGGDIAIINTELALADLETVNRRLPVMDKLVRADPQLRPRLVYLEKIKAELEAGRPVLPWLMAQEPDPSLTLLMNELSLITAKPVIYVFNLDEAALTDRERQTDLAALVAPASALFICAKLESELRGLDAGDQAELMQSYGQTQPSVVRLINAAYEVLGLQSFLTAGVKEVRAWTIKRGSSAQTAAGVIHSDFARGFIAADIVSYTDLLTCGSWTAARAAGLVRTEGKTYLMQPDDVVEFKFNVSR